VEGSIELNSLKGYILFALLAAKMIRGRRLHIFFIIYALTAKTRELSIFMNVGIKLLIDV
jgi:hypothetical protein